MSNPRIIGIDAATVVGRIGLAMGDISEGQCLIHEALTCKDPVQQIARWIEQGPEVILLSVDAPLGWPTVLGQTLVDHEAGMAPGVPRKEANRLFRRHTDIEIKARLGKQPLDVGADRIARTAHSILCRLHTLSDHCKKAQDLPLAWNLPLNAGCHLLEVYPAATLKAMRAPTRGYKKSTEEGRQARSVIVEWLQKELLIDVNTEALIKSDDVLDATLCVLAGFDFLSGRAVGPSAEESSLAKKEGWIWCRRLPNIE